MTWLFFLLSSWSREGYNDYRFLRRFLKDWDRFNKGHIIFLPCNDLGNIGSDVLVSRLEKSRT